MRAVTIVRLEDWRIVLRWPICPSAHLPIRPFANPLIHSLGIILFSLACTTGRADRSAVPVPGAPEPVAAGLAEADRLALRGCYLCLKEAAAVYSSLLARSRDPRVAEHALENNLMIALREVELRIPDSGARGDAEALEARVPSSYAPYFAALDSLATPIITGGITTPETRARRETRAELAMALENEWPASPMKAYFYIAMALTAGRVGDLKPQVDAILSTHPQALSLEYRMQAFLPTFSEEKARALIGQETGFGEVHFVLGQRAVLDARLADAYRELTRARQLLPDSAAVALVLANVTMAFAKYPEALNLFERVLAAGPDDDAQMGQAKALSYMGRHADAILVLDALLEDLRNNPGEKYYWRAWNRLRQSQVPLAYEDATAALKGMRNHDVYRLAGIASFHLNRLTEARGYFDSALRMNGADCDALRHLAQVDAIGRDWKPAVARFTSAVACYDQALARMGSELAEHERDISGLSNGLITSLRAEIKDVQGLRAISADNADLISKSAGFRAP